MKSLLIKTLVLWPLLAGTVQAQDVNYRLAAPPSAEECHRWATALNGGVLTGWLAYCPELAPSAFAAAVRAARLLTDTAYLSGLAARAGDVRDLRIFDAALEVAADGRASDRARIMSLLITVSQLGSSQDVAFHSIARSALFTQVLPAEGMCGFGPASRDGVAFDNGLPDDANRRAARVIDGIRFANGTSALLRNFARCARSAVGRDIPPQVDVSQIRLDYVCGTEFRIQNHTGVWLDMSYVVKDASGATVDAASVAPPAKGGWTHFETSSRVTLGTLYLNYDGVQIAAAQATGKPCGGRSP